MQQDSNKISKPIFFLENQIITLNPYEHYDACKTKKVTVQFTNTQPHTLKKDVLLGRLRHTQATYLRFLS